MKLLLLSSAFTFFHSTTVTTVNAHTNVHASAQSLRGSVSSANSLSKCIAPQDWRFKNQDHQAVCDSFTRTNVPYDCDGGDRLCCSNTEMTDVTFDKFGQCHKVYYPVTPTAKVCCKVPSNMSCPADAPNEQDGLDNAAVCCPDGDITWWEPDSIKACPVAPTPTRPNKKHKHPLQAEECCTVSPNVSCPVDAPSEEDSGLDNAAVCCPDGEVTWWDPDTIMACYYD